MNLLAYKSPPCFYIRIKKKRKAKYTPSSEAEREMLEVLSKAKREIKKINSNDSSFDIAPVDSFYTTLKTTNQLFVFLTNKENDYIFLKYQTQKILYYMIQTLMKSRRHLEKSVKFTQEENLKMLKIIKMVMMINPYLSIVKLNYDNFLKYMFALINEEKKDKKMIKVCVNIIEAILVANNFMIDLEHFPTLFDFFETCSDADFSNFMRVMALIVLELNEYKTEDFFELRLNLCESVMIKNHSFLLMTGRFLHRCYLILFAIRKIIDAFYNAQSPADFRKWWGVLEAKDYLEISAFSPSTPFQLIMNRDQFLLRGNLKSELLFVVSNLLSGKRKIDVQNHLHSLGFVDNILNPLFDVLFHERILNANEVPRFEDDDELGESNPDSLSTIRIQFLRIIINFSDRDAANSGIKNAFISKAEMAVLLQKVLPKILRSHYFKFDFMDTGLESLSESEINHIIDYTSSQENEDFPLSNVDFFPEIFEKIEQKGLILKVCNVLMSLQKNSPYRFWLASVVESFLRGFTPLHQIFVACQGLISFLLKQLIFDRSMKTNNIQITFDLLGEIVKFNKVNIILLNKACLDNDYLHLLLEMMQENIIDSNVFLRSLIIGFKKFKIIRKNEKNPFLKEKVLNFTEELGIYKVVKRQEKKWLKLLIKYIEPKDLNPDNICCINTALIICILRGNEKKLYDLLNELKANFFNEKKTLLDNFINLLEVWQNYYMNKNKDCFGLQYSTNINFFHFKQMKGRIKSYSRAK